MSVRQRGSSTEICSADSTTKSYGSTANSNDTSTPIRLSTFSELSPWQQDNEFIRSGYVRETLSFQKCIKSLGYLHNESVNVYSHMVPAILYLTFVGLNIPSGAPLQAKASFYLFGIAATSCLGLSSAFHCIKTHSEHVDKKGSQCDYFGIVVMITLSLISAVSLALPFAPCAFFTSLFLILGTICAVLTLDDKFGSPVYRPIRAAMFVIFGLSGTFPVVWAVYNWGYKEASHLLGMNWLFGEAGFYIAGAAIYAARVPERFAVISPNRGRFDYFGSSHQIFHFFVVVASYCHWRSLLECYKNFK